MAISRFVLKMLPGIDRPAIATVLPTLKGQTYVLDLGANVDCEPEHLLQFGIMGSELVSAVEHKARPTVGLLNIGAEDIKGNELVKRAAELLRASGLNFHGNVEGDDIYKGTTDIVVCDGFVGNVALKTSEGLAQMLAAYLREEFSRNLLTKLAGLVALPVINAFKRRVDHRRYNGASLLGLRGIVIKSHGSADAFAFAFAIRRAVRGGAQRRAGAHHRTHGGHTTRAQRERQLFPHRRHRQLSSGKGADQSRSGGAGGYHRRMDLHAHRHPPAAYGCGRRENQRPRAAGRAARRWRRPA